MSEAKKIARDGAVSVLYAMDITGHDIDRTLIGCREVLEEFEPGVGDVWNDVARRVRGAGEQLEILNDEIQAVSPRWRVNRMDVVDRNILRLGAWEILETDVPAIVTINACIEIGKKYGSESTPGFINGLLDELCSAHDIEVG